MSTSTTRGNNDAGTSNLSVDSEIQLIEAHFETGFAAEMLQGALNSHETHPHVLAAISNLVNAAAYLAATAFDVSGFTVDAALKANEIAQNQTKRALAEFNFTL